MLIFLPGLFKTSIACICNRCSINFYKGAQEKKCPEYAKFAGKKQLLGIT